MSTVQSLAELSARPTEHKNTLFLTADSEAALAKKFIEKIAEYGFSPLGAPSSGGNGSAPADSSTTGNASATDDDGSIVLAGQSAADGCAPADLSAARLVFAGGRGLHSEECFRKLEKLAGLYGAAVAVSRPLSDAGWADEKTQMVGVSGNKTAPELYIAFGISGAIQHMGGAKAAKHVMAVNNNYNSQIFRFCDYAVNGDAESLIENMLAELRTGEYDK